MVHPLTQLLPSLKMWNRLGGNHDSLTTLRVTSLTLRVVINSKATEATYFNSVVVSQGLRHFVEDVVNGQLYVFGGEFWEFTG